MTPFKLLSKGSTPTFLDSAFANKVLTLLNGLIAAKVTPAGAGKFVVTDGGIVLDLSATQAVKQAAQIANLTNAIANLQGQVSAINAALRAATIAATASCDPETSAITVTVTLTIPKLP